MSFDSSLRSTLLNHSEPFRVDTERGLIEVTQRVRSTNRRRAALKGVAVVTLAFAAVWLPRADPVDRQREVPPAREERVTPRPDRPDKNRPVRVRSVVPGPDRGDDQQNRRKDPSRSTGRVDSRAVAPPNRDVRERVSQQPAPPQVQAETWSRVRQERYEVNYVAGTHVSENGASGCWQGEGVTESNDCMPFEVGAGESEVAIELISDNGGSVGIKVSEYHRSESTDHGIFCDATGPLAVHPAGMVQIRIDTSGHCSEQRPTTGQLIVRFR